jgi:thymidylate kinase
MNVIIFEGPDASGKTTLAKRVAKEFGAHYIHMSGNERLHQAMREYHMQVLEDIEWNVENNSDLIVMDRCWMSELVYAGALRLQWLDRFKWEEFHRRFKKLGALYVRCMTDEIRTLHQKLVDPRHSYDSFQYNKIVCRYQDIGFPAVEKDPHIDYDRAKMTVAMGAQMVSDAMRGRLQ